MYVQSEKDKLLFYNTLKISHDKYKNKLSIIANSIDEFNPKGLFILCNPYFTLSCKMNGPNVGFYSKASISISFIQTFNLYCNN